MLDVKHLQKAYGPQVLLDDVTFTVADGEKVGLIGANGTGKSTLFQILVGLESADDGDINLGRGQELGFLAQQPDFEEGDTPRTVVARAVGDVVESIEEFEQVSAKLAEGGDNVDVLLARQAALQEKIERSGGWNWQHRVENVLDQLRIAEADMDRKVVHLSGGQKRRVALAKLLLEQPEILILDEPTNHLDAETIEWLEPTLQNYEGSVLLVTHDRYFLEHVVTRIVELDHGIMRSYPGNYSVYMARKLERMRTLEVQQSKRMNILRGELEWLSRGPKARGTKARGRKKQIGGLQSEKKQTKKLLEQNRMQMQFRADEEHGRVILEAHGIHKSYPDPEHPDDPEREKKILNGVSFTMRQGDKLAIVGPNGAGKTTLLEAVLGQFRADQFEDEDEQAPLGQRLANVPQRTELGIQIDGGVVNWGKNVRIAYMGQGRDDLDENSTVYDAIGPVERVRVGDRRLHKRNFLQEFLFDYGAQQKKVAALSGGERCRLLLAKIITENANFIVLDEPTNDLDIDSLQVLEDALAEFPGCALIVTHDRYFINRVCNAIIALEDGKVQRYEGDWDWYRQKKDEERQQEAARRAEAEAAAAQKEAKRQAQADKEAGGEPRQKKLSRKERRELEEIEGKILEAEEKKSELEQTLADPETYKKDGDEIAELTRNLEEAGKDVEALYERWEELESRA